MAELGEVRVWPGRLKLRDSALKDEQWLGVRPATPKERRSLGFSAKQIVNTFVFRTCGLALPVIIGQEAGHSNMMSPTAMRKGIQRIVERHCGADPTAISTNLLAVLLTMSPSATAWLEAARPKQTCPGCKCVFQPGGPLDLDSPERVSAEQSAAVFRTKVNQGKASEAPPAGLH